MRRDGGAVGKMSKVSVEWLGGGNAGLLEVEAGTKPGEDQLV